jgi:hypothetical protein
VEAGESTAAEGQRTAERTADKQASGSADSGKTTADTGDSADGSAAGIISVEEANETLQSYDDEETVWEEIYIDSIRIWW